MLNQHSLLTTPPRYNLVTASIEVANCGYFWDDLQLSEWDEAEELKWMEKAKDGSHLYSNVRGMYLTDDRRWLFRVLVTRAVRADRGQDTRRRNPMEENPNLFREFAFLPPNEDDFAVFASEWGLLTHEDCVRRKEGGVDRGEALGRWIFYNHIMRNLVEVHDMLLNHDIDGLSKRFYWDEEGLHYLHDDSNGERFNWIYSTKYSQSNRIKAGNISGNSYVKAATLFLEEWVSEMLRQKTEATIRWDEKAMRYRLHMIFTSLLGALVLQFANALTGDKQYRRCGYEGCGTWFEISPEYGKRRQSKFCCESCRQAHYYHSEKGKKTRCARQQSKKSRLGK